MEQLDTARDLATVLKVSVAAVRKWTRTTDMPRVQCGRAVRFDRKSVLEWFKAKQQGNK
jgi:excisionase family DNA binding protein